MSKDRIETIKQMIKQARFRLSPDAEQNLATEVAGLLHNFDILADVEVSEGIERLTLSVNELRADEPVPSQPNELALQNAPDSGDGFIAIPKVLPEERSSDA